METVDVLVQIWDRGQCRKAVVQVPESAFVTGCWRTIAALAAAVEFGISFVDVERVARYGLRPEDKQRLFEQNKAGADSLLCSE